VEEAEIVIISDATLPRGSSELEAAVAAYPSLRVASHGAPDAADNVPRGSALRKNLGLANTQGDFVLLLSVMDLVEPECVRELLSFMRANPDVGAAGALLLTEKGWPRRSDVGFPRLCPWLGLLRRGLHMLNRKARRGGTLRIERGGARRVDALPAACALLRRETFERVGEFQEGYAFRFDDLDWAWRARRKGWKFFLAPAAKAYHVVPLQAGPIPLPVRLAYEESLRRFLLENRGTVYRTLFRAIRMTGVATACLTAGIAVLASGFIARAPVEHFRMNLAVLRWRRGTSRHAPMPQIGDAEQTTRWEYAAWRAE
jgi:GT2 family glycosyltransferase